MTNPHSELVNAIIGTYSRGNCRLFKRHVAKAIPVYSKQVIQFGIKGEPDIQGFIKLDKYPYALFVAIEVKTGKAKRNKQQVAWGNMALKFGVVYIVARSLEDVERRFKEVQGFC